MQRENRVVFVVVDGMYDGAARELFGFVEGMIEQNLGLRARVRSILPSLSRPCYEAIFTGTDPIRNGIVANDIVRTSTQTSIFDVLKASGRKSAVVGYHWISELYHRAPFDMVLDREQNDSSGRIAHGRYYFEDSYPDSHAFVDAENLRLTVDPDFLVIHPMGVDDAGHRFGSASREYRGAVARMDMILSRLLPTWLQEGYDVVITADHGMDEMGFHGGTTDQVRMTPLYVFSKQLKQFGHVEDVVAQTTLAHLLCQFLKIEKAEAMQLFPEDFQNRWF